MSRIISQTHWINACGFYEKPDMAEMQIIIFAYLYEQYKEQEKGITKAMSK